MRGHSVLPSNILFFDGQQRSVVSDENEAVSGFLILQPVQKMCHLGAFKLNIEIRKEIVDFRIDGGR